VRKLEKVQKKVLFSSGTNVHVGSGWKPEMIGLWYVDTFWAVLCVAKRAVATAAIVRCSISVRKLSSQKEYLCLHWYENCD
jgi:hypothetical protein